MYLDQNIELLASLKGYTGVSLANELEVPAAQMSKYMKGDSIPRMDILIKIARLFDTNIHDFIMLDLSESKGRPFDGDDGQYSDEKIEELNQLLRLRVQTLEREILRDNPDLAKELGIE